MPMLTKNFLLSNAQRTKTILDIAYKNHINVILESLDEEAKYRWEIYDIIICELIKQGNFDYFEELKYRLTDGEDPNEIILDFINREGEDVNGLIWSLKNRIEEYIEEDMFKRFFT
jgi:hypothetical protein